MRRMALLAGLTLGTSGCTWLMGHGDVPQPRSPQQVVAAEAHARVANVTAQVRFLGVGERVMVSRNVWGRVGRVVNPYGEDTLLFDVRVANGGEYPITLLPAEARLQVDRSAEARPRSLDDFRARWPSWAVANTQQGEDRDAAYRFVLDTLLLERLVPPGESASGRLAFPLGAETGDLKLSLPYKEGRHKPVLLFKWKER